MENLSHALVEALLDIAAHRDEASQKALRSILRHLKELTDQEAAALRHALMTAAEHVDPFGPEQQLIESLDEALFGEDEI